MENYKISVIIPVYGVEPFIRACLTSVAAQTYKGEIECLIVDDCGTDNSIKIAEEFVQRYQGNIDFRIIHRSENGGLSAARNTGIYESTGDYLYFLDSDDEITPQCIELLSKALANKSYDFLIGNYTLVNAKKQYSSLKLDSGEILGNDAIFDTYRKGEWYEMAVNKLINSDFLKKNSLYFEKRLIHEDMLWSFRLASKATSMFVVTNSTYIYKIREGSISEISSASVEKDVENYLKVARLMVNGLQKAECSKINYVCELLKNVVLYPCIQNGIEVKNIYNEICSLLTPVISGMRISRWNYPFLIDFKKSLILLKIEHQLRQLKNSIR